jgi:hypothetical protein
MNPLYLPRKADRPSCHRYLKSPKTGGFSFVAALAEMKALDCFTWFIRALLDDPRAPLGAREVRNEQPHREKRSNPLSFDNGKPLPLPLKWLYLIYHILLRFISVLISPRYLIF